MRACLASRQRAQWSSALPTVSPLKSSSTTGKTTGGAINYDNGSETPTLAYALTINKSQGSQWPVVICPIAQKSIILNRKLMYTMYTRAEDTNILIGNPDYISNAISDDREDRRITLLGQRLKEMNK